MRNFVKDRRGTLALVTTILAFPLIGMLALGAEAGTWYVTKQHAQNAADAAAYSGALRLACQIGAPTGSCTDNPGSCADLASCVAYRGRQFATQDGFTNGASQKDGSTQSVQVLVGNYNAAATPSWTTTTNGSFVQATVLQNNVPRNVSALFGMGAVNIGAVAIARVLNPKNICGLGLGRYSGGGSPTSALTIGGNAKFAGDGCALMSDSTVNYNSTPQFLSGTGWAIDGVNGCDKTSTAQCDPGVPYNYYMPPATNPFQKLDSDFTTVSGSTKPCGNSVSTGQSCTINPNTPSTAYGDLKVTGGSATFKSGGTYFFNNATVSVNSGSLTGTNISIVLLGNSSISFTGGTVTLSAPTVNATYADLSGVLIDDQAPNKSSNAVTINGNSAVKIALGGAMYFPNVDVTWAGTTQSQNTTCTEVVANSLTIGGSSYMSTANCAAGVPYTQVVALVK